MRPRITGGRSSSWLSMTCFPNSTSRVSTPTAERWASRKFAIFTTSLLCDASPLMLENPTHSFNLTVRYQKYKDIPGYSDSITKALDECVSVIVYEIDEFLRGRHSNLIYLNCEANRSYGARLLHHGRENNCKFKSNLIAANRTAARNTNSIASALWQYSWPLRRPRILQIHGTSHRVR